MQCHKLAVWVRRTQFTGDHPFCAIHAPEQDNFEEKGSMFYWENISQKDAEGEVEVKKHPVEVAGYSDSLEELATAILRMRYDKVEEFFGHCALELQRQADADRKKGRHELSLMLYGTMSMTKIQQQQFSRIFALCKSHMKNELK